MASATLTSKGQVTLPNRSTRCRDFLAFSSGDIDPTLLMSLAGAVASAKQTIACATTPQKTGSGFTADPND
jgi:hypothetical protein